METSQNTEHTSEIKKVHQLLAKNIDDFKYLVLCNMRLEEKDKPLSEPLLLDVNRISDIEQMPSESLEEWVGREFAPKIAKTEEPRFTTDVSDETLEQWVAKQRIKSKKNKSKATIIDKVEQWLINEAKKDLFAEIDALNAGPEKLSSEHIRELGLNLISLADKLDKMKSKTLVS